MMRYAVAVAAGALLTGGCTSSSSAPLADPGAPTTRTTRSVLPTAPSTVSPTASAKPVPVRVPNFSPERAMDDVRHLAVDIGPRLATGPRFREAARWVARRLRHLDYDVTTQTFPVPAGDSWGVPVGAGTSANVVARPKGFDPGAPYLLVGAHLDTVAVAPGAEDNASGVSVLLETARRATILPRRLPVVFVAFGGEEPRGPGDLHHFGSLHYVAQMSPAERRNLRAMVSMDRVGVGRVVPGRVGAGHPDRGQGRPAPVGRRGSASAPPSS